MSGGIGSDFCARPDKAIAYAPTTIIDQAVMRGILVCLLLLDLPSSSCERTPLSIGMLRSGTWLALSCKYKNYDRHRS